VCILLAMSFLWKLFDKLTVEPRKQRKCSYCGRYAVSQAAQRVFFSTFGAYEYP